MTVLFWLFIAGYAVTLLAYLVPLAADAATGGPPRPPAAVGPLPRLVAIGPCRHAAASIPGFVRAVRAQVYPPDRVRVIVAVDRDDVADPSVSVARREGAEVAERFDPAVKTKGAALNAVLASLKDRDVDGVVVFDIDARPAPDFLARVAAHFRDGAPALQAATVGRGGDAPLARISELGQALSRRHQRGRAALGLPGFLSGGAMAFRRDALDRLDWTTSTGVHLSDDGELNLRCCLAGLAVRYAPDLEVRNEVPDDAREVRLQRRRWSAGYQELIVPYAGPMLRQLLRGRLRVLDYVASLLFASLFSLLFVAGGALAVTLALVALRHPAARPFAVAAAVPWLAHGGIYLYGLRAAGLRLGARDVAHLPVFLAMRALAFVEGWSLAYRRARRNPIPSAHRDDTADTMAAGGRR